MMLQQSLMQTRTLAPAVSRTPAPGVVRRVHRACRHIARAESDNNSAPQQSSQQSNTVFYGGVTYTEEQVRGPC